MNNEEIKALQGDALWVRQKILRMVSSAGHGHIGGSMSCVDILTVLYLGGIINSTPENIEHRERDRYIHSKGHACEVLYAVLAKAGFFPECILDTYGTDDSPLGGHIDSHLPGIELSTGSLGNGLGFGAGMALGARLQGQSFSTFVMMGDGECYEGSVWEAASFAAHHRLGNLIAIIDRNGEITLDNTEDCNAHEPFADKWNAFGWHVIEVNGHHYASLCKAFSDAKTESERPVVLIAETIKGKGVSFMEKEVGWHHRVPTGDLLIQAKQELGLDEQNN